MITLKGQIIKCIGGCYTVEAPDGIYQARARGIFRKNGLKPMAGDWVNLQLEDSAEPLITEIFERKNELIRPPMANLDLALLVVSACEPSPNAFVLDKLISIFESKKIETVLIFTKSDKALIDEFASVYQRIGYRTFTVNNVTGEGCAEIKEYIKGKISAVIGNSGVGKSSLLGHLVPEFDFKTNEISKKLGRGRHTTREVGLFMLKDGGYIADTPGFSTVEISKYGKIASADLAECFVEFVPYLEKCRFKDCRHFKETDCAVKKAVKAGEIAVSRHESYCRLYTETKENENTY